MADICHYQSVTEAKTTEQPALRVDPLPVPEVRGPGVSMWAWPVMGTIVVAAAGETLGTRGAVAGLAGCLSLACVLVGRLLDRPGRPRIILLSVALAACGALALAPHTPWTGRTGPVDLRGRKVTAAMVAKVDLHGAELNGAQLTGLDLRAESLTGAMAQGANLAMTQLNGVNLRGANLRGADLHEACLRGADLSGAILNGADISGADLSGAVLDPGVARYWNGRPGQAAAGCV